MKPIVVVLMSTYNGEKFLREQLDSVFAQKDVDIHLLVRDDGSTDKTLNLLNEYASIYSNMTILSECNCGAEMSFHRLCQYAKENITADYYAFCDQDDVWLPEKLITAVNSINHLESNKSCLYFSNLKMVDENLNEIRNLYADGEVVVSKRMALIQVFTYGCTCVFNRPALEAYCQAEFTDELAHDNWIYVLCMFLGCVYYDPNSYILYRQHGNNLSGEKYSGVKLAYQRSMRALKGHWGHDFELYASMLLKSFHDRLLSSDKLYINRIAQYRQSLCKKLSLLCSPFYRTGHFSKDIAIKIRILTNHL